MAPDPTEPLWTSLLDLRRAALTLRSTAVEDRPAGDAAVLDVLEDETTTLLGTVQDLVAAASAVRRAPDHLHARVALPRCRALVDEVARLLATIGAPGRRQDRHDLAAGRDLDWRAWTAALDQDLDRCREAFRAVGQALTGDP
jgi:hypothetical protein